MKAIVEFFHNHGKGVLGLVFVAAIFYFVHWKWNNVERNGVVTVAKVLRWESAEQGSNMYIEIYLEGKKYVADIDQGCQADCIGNFFFVKVNKDNPADYPIFYGGKPVPRCILEKVTDFKGWMTIPDCNNF